MSRKYDMQKNVEQENSDLSLAALARSSVLERKHLFSSSYPPIVKIKRYENPFSLQEHMHRA
jgi:hypothetical protein